MKKIHILGPNPEAFSNELSSLFPEVNFSIGSSRDDFGDSENVRLMLDAIDSSQRGLARPDSATFEINV